MRLLYCLVLGFPLISGIHHDSQHVISSEDSQHHEHEHEQGIQQLQQQAHTLVEHQQLLEQAQQQMQEGTDTDVEMEQEVAKGQQLLQGEMAHLIEMEADNEWFFSLKKPENKPHVTEQHWVRPGGVIPPNFLMNEADLVEATGGGRDAKGKPRNKSPITGLVAHLSPFSDAQKSLIRTIHDEWVAATSWLKKLGTMGYEFNWAYMYEPNTKKHRSYLPPVKQQHCGTCWAYTTSAIISAQLAVRYGIDRPYTQWYGETVDPLSLSEAELYQCTGKSGQDDVCYGNWVQNAGARVKADGIAQNTDYQFDTKLIAETNKCRLPSSCDAKKCPSTTVKVAKCNMWPQTCPSIKSKQRSDNPRFKIDSMVSVISPGGSPWTGGAPLQMEQIRDLLRTKGPLGFYFRVESGFGLNGQDTFPSSGAVYDKPCVGSGINHAMTLIGYGRTSSTDKQPNMDYWLVLNSWGNWSSDGIIKIRAGVNLCNSEQIVLYPQLPSADLTAGDPCAHQAGTDGPFNCYRSICENTILEDSRYCVGTGRKHWCDKMTSAGRCTTKSKTHKPCSKECDATCAKNGWWDRMKCWIKCDKSCKPECHLYEKICKAPAPTPIDRIADLDTLNAKLLAVTNFDSNKLQAVASTFTPINSLNQASTDGNGRGDGQTMIA